MLYIKYSVLIYLLSYNKLILVPAKIKHIQNKYLVHCMRVENIVSRIDLNLTPGPIEPPVDVKRALLLKTISHRSPEFTELYHNIDKLYNKIVGLEHDGETIIMPGSGTLGIDSVFANIVSKDTKALVIDTGFFGQRLADLLSRYTRNIDVAKYPLGTVPDKNDILARIENGEYDIVALVHNETSTGTTIRYLEEIGRKVRHHGGYLVIDGVSSVGAEEIYFSKWEIDAIVTGSQKALAAPAGLCIVTLSNRIIDAFEEFRSKIDRIPYYMDLLEYIRCKREYGWVPTTPPVNVVYAFYKSLEKINNYGIQEYFELHKKRAEEIYRYAMEKGLEPFVNNSKWRSRSVAVFKVEESTRIVDILRKTYGIQVSAGLGELNNKLIRIGIMGFIETTKVLKTINLIINIAGKKSSS